MVTPSTPAAPPLARTRCQARSRLARSRICSSKGTSFLTQGSRLPARRSRVRPGRESAPATKCQQGYYLTVMFGPSPCLSHCAEHSATMASADFCLLKRASCLASRYARTFWLLSYSWLRAVDSILAEWDLVTRESNRDLPNAQHRMISRPPRIRT